MRTARFAAHIIDIGADAVAGAEALARDHLVAAHDTFGAAKVHHHGAEFHALDDAVNDLADAVFIFFILALAFGIAHFLHDHLLCGLRGDAGEIDRRQGFGDDVTHHGGGIAQARVFQADLDLVVIDQFHDMQIARHMRLAGFGIDLHADFVLAAVARFRGALHGLFHRMQHDGFVDGFVAGDRIGNLQKFGTVGGNRGHVILSFSRVLARFHPSTGSG